MLLKKSNGATITRKKGPHVLLYALCETAQVYAEINASVMDVSYLTPSKRDNIAFARNSRSMILVAVISLYTLVEGLLFEPTVAVPGLFLFGGLCWRSVVEWASASSKMVPVF